MEDGMGGLGLLVAGGLFAFLAWSLLTMERPGFPPPPPRPPAPVKPKPDFLPPGQGMAGGIRCDYCRTWTPGLRCENCGASKTPPPRPAFPANRTIGGPVNISE